MLSIIYPYRNRELKRIKRSLDSLLEQTKQEFEVHFIDYGSNQELAEQVKQLVNSYSFTNYQYVYNIYQPWNKCKALNYVIKHLSTPYFFVSDVDMIFHSSFVTVALELAKPNKATYFQVGILTEQETKKELPFDDYQISFKTDQTATGMTLFPVQAVKDLRGFDEFYHFWGSEDTDIHERLKNNGVEVSYYDKTVFMLHQWHKTYRMKETKLLTEKLQLTGIVQLNHQHLSHVISNKITMANNEFWGNCMAQEDLKMLENPEYTFNLTNEKKEIDHLLFVILNNLKLGVYYFKIRASTHQKTLKYRTKKMLQKKVLVFYTLKEVNDMLLMHVISYLSNYPYTYKISKDLKSIEFCINNNKNT